MSLALLLTAIFGYPLLSPLHGRAIVGAEVFGITPDPTAVACLGATFLTTKRWYRRVLAALSLAWIGQSTITLFILDQRAAFTPATVLVLGLLGQLLLTIKSGDKQR